MKGNEKMKKVLVALLSGIYVVSAVVMGTNYVSATGVETADNAQRITIDGNVSEWAAMESLEVADGSVSEWKMAKSEDGSVLYLCFSGIATTQWDSHYDLDVLEVSYPEKTSFVCQFANLEQAWLTPGAEVAMVNGASGTNPGNYGVECALPISESGYTITFAGTKVAESDIPVFVWADEVEYAYEGIVIDGKYNDWNAVARVDAKCPNTEHQTECLKRVACVFDGDYIYLYLQDGENGAADGAGMASNGKYAITTDTGRQLVFQLSRGKGGEVSVDGVDGSSAAYFGDEWEIAIPVSQLPEWKEGVSFGLYQQEPFVTGVVDLQGNEGTAGEFHGIVYDGLFGDWSAYPHTLIQYATAGTQENQPDGEGALYLDGSTLYGHVQSSMSAHLAEAGGEFTSAISICFNGDKDYYGDKTWNLYPRLVAVAEDGTIDWSPTLTGLEDGLYEFYIADIRGEYNTQTLKNVSDLAEHEQFFGKMKIKVGETVDEMEFYIDLEQVAVFLSYYSDKKIEASDLKTVEAQFGRIGQEFLSTAGASSGPIIGIIIAVAVSFGIVFVARKRYKVVKQ